LDQTLIVITSDHGEHIGERQLFQHQFSVYEELVRVPLIMRHPGFFKPGTRIQEPVSLLDLMPTFEDILDEKISDEKGILTGKSLFEVMASKVPLKRNFMAEYAPPVSWIAKYKQKGLHFDESYFKRNLHSYHEGGFKFIWASDGQHELYNLKKDPRERVNLVSHFPGMARTMQESLEANVSLLKKIKTSETLEPLDENLKLELRSLGYVQ